MDWVTRLSTQQRSDMFSEMATQKSTMPGVVEKDSGQGDLNKARRSRAAIFQGGIKV